MVVEDTSSNHDVALVQTFSSVAGAVCFIAIIALFVLKIFGKISACCTDLFQSKKNTSTDSNENKYDFLQKKPKARYEQLKPGTKSRPTSLSLESLDSYKHAMFQIPGMMAPQAMQPSYEGSTTSGYSTSGYSYAESVDSNVSDGRAFVDEYVQPREKELYNAGSGARGRGQYGGKKSWQSDSIDPDQGAVEGLMPGLYENRFRKTQSAGSLGKLKFSLQYEDKTKRKLIMTLHDILDLQFPRGTEQVVSVFITAILIPERDYKFQTKQLMRDTDIKLNEVFTFHSRPHNRDFEARTVQLTIVYLEKSNKEIAYGESRMPLLSHEIYSQVPTDITIGIKPCLSTVEIGDAQIVLSYSSQQRKLNVMVKTVRFANSSMLDHLTGLHIKAHLMRVGGDRVGKKRSVSKSLGSHSGSIIDFTEHMTFELEADKYMVCTLKLHIHGKHKIMGKHFSLGKIRIGDSNRDEGGKVHWMTVLNSEGIGWTMWHPICSS